jgi:hypothetical protein
MMEEQ